MSHLVQLDDRELSADIDRELARIRNSGVLGRSGKLIELFDFLVSRSREGNPPKEIEIAQDVFGRVADGNDDGTGRVYIHRLRRRLDSAYDDITAPALRITLPLGEYRLVASVADGSGPDVLPAVAETAVRRQRGWPRLVAAALAGSLITLAIAAMLLPWPRSEWFGAERARDSIIWRPLLENGRNVVIAEGDHYLFAEKASGGGGFRLIRDGQINSRSELDAYLLRHPADAERYLDVGLGYVPRTIPRAQLYLSPILLGAENVRSLPASQISDAALLSQNVVYLGLASGLGPLRAPTTSGARFQTGSRDDAIVDHSTGRVYESGLHHGNPTAPRRQYGLVSLFPGKEGNRFIILAGTSEMGLVGLVETLSDPARLEELAAAGARSDAIEALYQVDSQGGGILAVRLLAANARDPRRIWQPL